MPSAACIVYVTTPHGKISKTLSSAILKDRLAACVSAVPVTSAYRWNGKINTDREILLIIKTEQRHLKKLCSLVCRLHPYDVPEIIALPVTGGFKPYLDWIHAETK